MHSPCHRPLNFGAAPGGQKVSMQTGAVPMRYSTLLLMSAVLIIAGAALAEEPVEPMKPSTAAKVLMDDDTKDFFETAASANQFEIESSKMAKKMATDPALKEFANHMIKDHTKASRDLQTLAKKKGVALDVKLLKRHQAMLDDLRDEQPGKDFDEEYRAKMIASHKEAVSLFDEAAQDNKDTEIRAFAAKTLPTLQKHGGMAKKLPEPGASAG
jgi:putative membrane protein